MKQAMIAAIIILLLLAGCGPLVAPEAAPPAPAASPAPLTDAQVLQHYDDGLDAAFKDLDQVG